MDAQSPEDLTRQAEARDVVVGRETRAYDDLHAAEVLLQVRETEVEAARDDVAVQRRAAAAHLVDHARADRADPGREAEGRRSTSPPAARPYAAAARARRQDQAVLARLRQREDSIRDRILAAARRAARSNAGYHGRTAGLLSMPGRRPGHLAVRLPGPPDLPLLQPARRHRLRRRLRPAAARGRRRHA